MTSKSELTEIMSHPRILCLGEMLVDCLRDVAEAGGADAPLEAWTHQAGGAPANVACALARLGTPAGFVGAIGADAAGDMLREMLESRGVDVSMLATVDAPTRHVFVERDTSGDRRFVGFGTGDRATDTASGSFADAQLEATTFKAAAIVRMDWLVTGTLGLAQSTSARAIERAVGMAKQSMTSVFVDVNWRAVFWQDFAGSDRFGDPETPRDRILRFLTKADWLKFSDDDARYLLDTDDAIEIAERFRGARGVIVTRGERGCAYRVGAIEGEIPAFTANAASAIDTTGAGDSFVAALLHQFCAASDPGKIADSPETLRAAIEFASMAGALTTRKMGAIAAQPTTEEIRAAIDARNADR